MIYAYKKFCAEQRALSSRGLTAGSRGNPLHGIRCLDPAVKPRDDRCAGMILISMLIFMSLITLLVTIGLESAELQMRMSNNSRQQAQTFQVAQYGLQQAYMAVKDREVHCQLSLHSVYDLSVMPASCGILRLLVMEIF